MTPAEMVAALHQAITDDRISPMFAGELGGWIGVLTGRAEAAEAEVERLRLPENRGIGDTEITAALQERDALRLEVKRLRTGVKRLRAALRQVDEHLTPRTPGGE